MFPRRPLHPLPTSYPGFIRETMAPAFLRSFSHLRTMSFGGKNSNGNANGVDSGDKPAPNGSLTSTPEFKLGDFAIDESPPIKVVVIGAGFSGVTAGVRLPQYIKNIDLTIYDKNAGVGGTWYSNRYPGLACDIPSHTYQLTFEPNTNWSSFYAPAREIRAYIEGVATKYKLERYLKLSHELVHARYDEPSGKWHLRLRRPVPATAKYTQTPDTNGATDTNNSNGSRKTNRTAEEEEETEEIEDTADFVLFCAGGLSRWSWPDIEGLRSFEGTLLHSAKWMSDDWQEDVKDWGDKRVGVIGVGSSALQIVPALQPKVGQVLNFVRGKTWLSPPFFSETLADLMKRDPDSTNYTFSEDDRRKFKEDPEYYKAFRHELENVINSIHHTTLKDPERQVKDEAEFRRSMADRVAKKPWIADHIIPSFPIACRRLTPGNGYLESLCEDNVEFIPKEIKRVTPKGIETADGQLYELDVLICATGYDTNYQYPFPIVGRNGKTLQDHYTPHPVTYLSLCTDGFPNWFNTLGPNSAIGSGALLCVIEKEVEYAAKVVQKMQRERIKSIDVKREAVEDFDRYLQAYFPKTVYSSKCRSWYKMGKEEGRVSGLWPGSSLHALRAFEHPRWEDFDYEYQNTGEEGSAVSRSNRFHWLGDGFSYNEKYMVGDRAWYLRDDQVDYPPVPE
ncbi:FAD/NAD(P)-binding domain-containing protein [Coniophora puteana RWD-64-598 SS2]|uniref:FAD/NAD(P)-binding domain-containing protein n=1 Tax=Coniophora puteana (strain RWD-64-598) TaxID=741705 RepID=R7SEC1_CONPW|nr:FAD/NAD(P)-binding domain-containing protein [Coniophora puteana RWD-64-598 SS2]EIW74531.1 FAD/NAD(P)-binding domain-containing protein [Coniophora puteana RWD-64-598 SS2]